MPPKSNPPPRLPTQSELRTKLKAPADFAILNEYLEIVRRQPRGQENGLRRLLQACAEAGNVKFVEVLLSRGANVNASTQATSAPLLCAAEASQPAVVEALLLSEHVDVEVVDRNGRTALMHAAQNAQIDIIKMLLQKGANIDAIDKQERSAVTYAASSGNAAALAILLDQGADLKATDKHGRSAVIHAASTGRANTLEALLDCGADVNHADMQDRTAAVHAAAGGHADALEVLLRRGVHRNKRDNTGRTALLHAAANGDPRILELLLAHGVNVDIRDNEGQSSLTLAILREKKELNDDERAVSMLLEAGAEVRSVDQSVKCLKYAALRGQNEILRALIRFGAQINAVDGNSKTVLLHLASDTSKSPKWNQETVSTLLLAGADVSHVDNEKSTGRRRNVLHFAAALGHTMLAQAVLNHVEADKRTMYANNATNRRKTALHLAAQHGHTDIVRLLLNQNAEIDARSEGDWTPLLIASKAGHDKTVEALLSATKPANVNARTSTGATSLHWAAINGHTEVVKKILSYDGAWTNPKDAFDTTPLLRAGQHDHEETIELLREHLFAGPSLRTSRNAQLACDNFTASVVDFYLGRGQDIHNEVRRMSVRKVLYDMDPDSKRTGKFAVTTRLDQINKGSPSFRWIHLPSNNLAWAEVLITKMMLEEGPIDVGGFQSMLRVFGQQQHWGSKAHSRFMRPLCQVYSSQPSVVPPSKGTAHVPFAPVKKNLSDADDTLEMKDAGNTSKVVEAGETEPVVFQSIFVMQPYRRYSPEELRLADYELGRRYNKRNKQNDALSVSETSQFGATIKNSQINLAAGVPLRLDSSMSSKSDPTSLDPVNRDLWNTPSRSRAIAQQSPRTWDNNPGLGFARSHSPQGLGSTSSRRTRPPQLNLPYRGPFSTSMEESPPDTRHTPVSIITAPPTPASGSRAPSASRSSTLQSVFAGSKHLSALATKDIGVLFMPYLHWEEDCNRQRMEDIVKNVMSGHKPERNKGRGRDEYLIRGYLQDGSTDLHLRRTLDQFKHSTINTNKLDEDQVVSRYQRETNKKKTKPTEPKIFMVDQMWIWMFRGIIITCFPERWDQPVRDHLSIFDGVIEDINSGTYPTVKSVQDLVAFITNRCIGSFDRHEWGYEDLDYKFFEIFELSIGTLTRRATALLQRFKSDSTAATKWLRYRDKYRFPHTWTELLAKRDEDREDEEDDWLKEPNEDDANITKADRNPVFVNRLLNISKETELLVECKDIEDELSILTTVLEQQKDVLRQMGDVLKVSKKRAGMQVRLIEQHLLDISRMLKQANGVNRSLTQVLDLKQKHANAIEARFARDQAEDTARQGQTIMVFTLVTIVFLPLSFMASIFAINITEFPHDPSNGGNGLPLGWVFKYLFGIGFAVSVPLITIAFVFGDIRGWTWQFRSWLGSLRNRQTIQQQQVRPNQQQTSHRLQHPSPPPPYATQMSGPTNGDGSADQLHNRRDTEGYRYPRRPTHVGTGLSHGTVDSVENSHDMV